jgi:signal transduction histidine kinase
MYKFILVLVWSLGLVNGFSQTKMIDSLKRQLEIHSKDDTVKINFLIELSYQYQWQNFYHSLAYAEQALKLSEQLPFKKGAAIASYRLAHCYWALGDSELGIEKGLVAIDIAEREHFPIVLAEAYQILARNYMDQRENEKAETYIKKAEEISLPAKNWDLLSRIYNLAGVIQFLKTNEDSALVLYKKALRIVQEYPTSKYQLAPITSNIGECYTATNPNLALDYFYNAISIAKETHNRSAEAATSGHLGRALLKKKKYAEAEKYFLASLKLARELGLKRVIRHAYGALADLKVLEGKSAEALAYMKKSYDVRDSIINGVKTRQIVGLENRYEKEKKEQQIKFLEQEKTIESIWKNVLLVGSILLILTLIIIFRLQQLRNRKAKLLLATQEKLNAKLKETDELKTKFFANISHEFRTPLTLILAPIEDKISSPLTSSSDKEGLLLVRRNANRLLDLVNQLLDLSKLKVGKMELQLKKGNIHEFLHVLVASFNSLAESRQILFSKNLLMPTKEVEFDADKLEKIISNILFNAFKFTQPGGTVTIYAQVSITGEISLEVADTGKGIPEEDQAHVFSPFYQSKHTFDDGRIGTGLGLALVSELVKIYNGEIKLTSKVDSGTTISVTIPSQFNNRSTYQKVNAHPFNQN